MLEAAAWADTPVKPSVFYASDDARAGQATRGLITDAGFKPVNTGPLKGARQLEQAGVLLHHIVDYEYAGDAAGLVRFGLAIIEAGPGPIERERIV
ncbi:hypothetical protein [Phyllobacterium sp. SB3]|uniref:hypothetical protein n=1 Tax=Phyllobacterium sp. SB3 TaxID=3156073 RepID=UPI0032AEBEFC